MRRRRSHIFTPAAIETLRRLAREGSLLQTIANAIGSTAASVRVRCSQLRIKLAQGSRTDSPKALQLDSPKARRRHFRERQLIIGMNPAVYAALEQKAARKHKSTSGFARMLLEAIVSSDIYEAVLDDGD